MNDLTWNEFERVEMRVGTIVSAMDFPEARNPAYKLEIDLGSEIGVKKSSAQITKRYSKEELIGKQVVCTVNFPAKQIGPFISEVLVMGAVLPEKDVVLITLDQPIENGYRIA